MKILSCLRRTEQPAVEDVFESFAGCFELAPACETTIIATSNKTTKSVEDIFHPFRHNFHVPAPRPEDLDILSSTAACLLPFKCGEPTIKSIVSKTSKESAATVRKSWLESSKAPKANKSSKKGGRHVEESKDVGKEAEIAVNWEKMLIPSSVTKSQKPKKAKQGIKVEKIRIEYKQESIFAEWIQNLEEPKPVRQPQQPSSPNSSPRMSPKASPKADRVKKAKNEPAAIQEDDIQDVKVNIKFNTLNLPSIYSSNGLFFSRQ